MLYMILVEVMYRKKVILYLTYFIFSNIHFS